MPTFDSNGVAIDYDVEGDGPPIVLVHGFASNAQGIWRAPGIIKALVDSGRRVITLDCRGHGKSGKPHDPEDYAGTAMPDDVIALMDHLDVRVADLWGYSMGGIFAATLLVNHPERFRSVILSGIGDALLASGRSRVQSERIAAALETDGGANAGDATARNFRVFAERSGNDLAALGAMQKSTRNGFDPAKLTQTKLPVLILVGDKDTLIVSADKLAAAIPRAEYAKVPGDHLTAVVAPEFKAAGLAFLAKQSPVVG